MHLKYLVLLLTYFCLSNHSFGQQQVHYTQYLNNKLWMNPGYAGSHNRLSIQAISRNQWIGLDGAPRTSAISLHTPLKNDRIGLGLTITTDQAGPMNSLAITGNYSYGLFHNEAFKISLGLQTSMMRYELDFRDIQTTSAGDQSFLEEPASMNLVNFGFGVYAQSDRMFFGLSIPYLINNGLAFNEIDGIQRAQQDIHAYLMAGYLFTYNKNIDIKASLLLKYLNNAPIDMDISGTAIFNDRLWAGFNYRLGGQQVDFLGESIDLIFQYQVSTRTRLGLSYDYTIGELQFETSGTLEFLAQYVFVNKGSARSIQYF